MPLGSGGALVFLDSIHSERKRGTPLLCRVLRKPAVTQIELEPRFARALMHSEAQAKMELLPCSSVAEPRGATPVKKHIQLNDNKF